jgi:hypothetical protein
MTEQQPIGTTFAAPPTAEQQATEQQRLNKQVYDFRKTCDPLLYERVIAFHQHANFSDDAFAQLSADYARVAAEVLPPVDPPAA